jgi:hypothetical protein
MHVVQQCLQMLEQLLDALVELATTFTIPCLSLQVPANVQIHVGSEEMLIR